MTDTPSTPSTPADDPMPVPPPELDPYACCGNGCDPCVVFLHDLAMDQYRQDLRAWQARQAAVSPPAGQP